MRLDEHLQRIDQKRRALLEQVEALDPDVLQAHPRPGKWSIHEIIEHLVVAEEDVFVDLHNLERLEARPRRLKNRLMYVIVMFVLKHDIAVEAPSEAMLPTRGLSLKELRELWEANHARLRHYLAGMDLARARRAIFRHPIAGPMTARDALRMLEVHLDRHVRQIRTLERMCREGEPR